MAEIAYLPTQGLMMLERALREFLAEKAVREQAVVQAQKDAERLAFALGVQMVEPSITFDLNPVGAGFEIE